MRVIFPSVWKIQFGRGGTESLSCLLLGPCAQFHFPKFPWTQSLRASGLTSSHTCLPDCTVPLLSKRVRFWCIFPLGEGKAWVDNWQQWQCCPICSHTHNSCMTNLREFVVNMAGGAKTEGFAFFPPGIHNFGWSKHSRRQRALLSPHNQIAAVHWGEGFFAWPLPK